VSATKGQDESISSFVIKNLIPVKIYPLCIKKKKKKVLYKQIKTLYLKMANWKRQSPESKRITRRDYA
jgi:hypothetical protein